MVLELVHEEKEVEVVETQCKKVPDEECNLETVLVKKPLEETICKTIRQTMHKLKTSEIFTVFFSNGK